MMGEIFLMVNRPLHWKALARWVHETTGNEEILDPMFEGSSLLRQPYRELLDIFIGEHTARFTVEQLYREGQRRHLALTPLNTVSAMCRDPHLAARGFFVEVPQADGRRWHVPGAPYRLSRAVPDRGARTAPRRARCRTGCAVDACCAHRERSSICRPPLAGLRVLNSPLAWPVRGSDVSWHGVVPT
ncbi:MAG: CoA transferase [Gammaproteobacteria bacterium]|nr:CoA transferase [Gammaproteobacteria bacterium]